MLRGIHFLFTSCAMLDEYGNQLEMMPCQKIEVLMLSLSIALLNGRISHQAGYFFRTSLGKVCEKAPLMCECVIWWESVCHTTKECDLTGLR